MGQAPFLVKLNATVGSQYYRTMLRYAECNYALQGEELKQGLNDANTHVPKNDRILIKGYLGLPYSLSCLCWKINVGL